MNDRTPKNLVPPANMETRFTSNRIKSQAAGITGLLLLFIILAIAIVNIAGR